MWPFFQLNVKSPPVGGLLIMVRVRLSVCFLLSLPRCRCFFLGPRPRCLKKDAALRHLPLSVLVRFLRTGIGPPHCTTYVVHVGGLIDKQDTLGYR